MDALNSSRATNKGKMTDADLEKHTDILVAAITDIVKRAGELTPDEDKHKELTTELEVQ
jgi:hypothetical protein